MTMWKPEDQARIEQAAHEHAEAVAHTEQAGAIFAAAVFGGVGASTDRSAVDALSDVMNAQIQHEQDPIDPAETFAAWAGANLTADADDNAHHLAHLGVHRTNLTNLTNQEN